MRRLVHVLTVAESLRFLRGQPAFMREHGLETHVVCTPSPLLHRFAVEEGAVAHSLPMQRAITPAADARALARLVGLLRELKPDVVHAQTPKGGLLGVLAGRVVHCPRVLYHMRGLPFVSLTGARRMLMTGTERAACGLAHAVICQSRSLREVVLAERLASPSKCEVLGPGGNGVDALERFDPDRHAPRRGEVRAALGIPASAPVVGFVGRLVRDKGIVELREAWQRVSRARPDAHLVLVGPFETRDPVPLEVRCALQNDPAVHLVDETEDVAPHYAALDVLVLPSYREGFPNVPIEGSAMRLPVVATRVTGCVDAVRDGVTGTLVEARCAGSLATAILRYLDDPELRRAHGEAGRAWVLEALDRRSIWRLLLRTYQPESLSSWD